MAPILLRSGRLLGVGLSFGFSLIGSTTLPHSSFCFIFKGCQINPKRGAPCQSLTHSWPLHFLPKGIYYSILFGMAQKTEPQFTLDQLEDVRFFCSLIAFFLQLLLAYLTYFCIISSIWILESPAYGGNCSSND